MVVGGGRKQKNVRTSEKILATPLIRTQMIDWFVIPVGIQSHHIPYQFSLIHEVKDNISLYKSKKKFSSWTISFDKIRRLRLEKIKRFWGVISEKVEPCGWIPLVKELSAEDPGINKTKERRGKDGSERSIRNRLLLSYQQESDEVIKLI